MRSNSGKTRAATHITSADLSEVSKFKTKDALYHNKLIKHKATDLGRLCCHLDADLQDGDGKLWMRAAAEPQSEVRMRLFHLQLFHKLIKLRHPAQGQVTVGQEHPVTLKEYSKRSMIYKLLINDAFSPKST